MFVGAPWHQRSLSELKALEYITNNAGVYQRQKLSERYLEYLPRTSFQPRDGHNINQRLARSLYQEVNSAVLQLLQASQL
jgi:hypothetical protein